MSLFRQFVDIGQPAPPAARPRPAVTESLRAQIAAPVRVEPAVNNVALVNKPEPAVNKPAVNEVAPVNQPGNASQPAPKRSSREAWNAYHRVDMRKRRAAVKADKLALAKVDP